jgi:uridylate kinase
MTIFATKQLNKHMKYKKNLLKLSGEALIDRHGTDPVRLAEYAEKSKDHDKG